MADFVHLHLHTAYSLLDGAIRLGDLFPRIRELGMNAVAMTDHGNMYGVLEFYQQAKKHGIKPIIGCEMYVAGNDRTDRSVRRNQHLVLLARDLEGYKNLRYLVSMAYLEGFHYVPRIDKPLLKEHHRGLIGLSACLGGEVAQALLKEGHERARQVALEYRDLFEPGAFYLEVQPNGLAEQEQVNAAWRTIGHETGIPLVATGDCHYVYQKDARAHEILMCIQQGKTINDEKRLQHPTDAYYIKSPAEFAAHFADLPEAMENAVKIAAACNVEFAETKPFLPRYQVPEGYDLERYLREVSQEGLERRFKEFSTIGKEVDLDEYRARLATELDVIVQMGFAGYFLIVWDFIRFAKEQGIPVGPGRGSGAGSLVAYGLRITDLDPLPYHLLFERFLNPERISMPDFDIDFCMNRRDEVIRYVTAKYGKANVGQIVTMHQLKARGVIRDIARVMAIPHADADKIAKLVPEPQQGKTPPIKECIEQNPKLKEFYATENGRILLDTAQALEGLNRHAGMHAAGIVISDEPLWDHVPCARGPNGEIVTQFAKDEVEKVGLVKFDFLGLKTLTAIDIAVKLIRREKPEFNLDAIPLDDAAVYKMISDGDTIGVFQFESSGFKDLLKRLRPDCFGDIIAAGALYRPGPLEGGMVDDFVRRKHGEVKVTYPHPLLQPILENTYGVIVYQEQVMQIARALAGYSLGGADVMRRAMGKKKAEAMEKEKAKFMEGAEKGGVARGIATQVFDLMEKFAGYGFNKSHSAAYGLITYQTAYLKHYFPEEFMAGLLTCDKDDTDKVVKNVGEARAIGIEVLRPDVEQSDCDFNVVRVEGEKTPRKVIRFGLSAVKGVGENAVAAIIEARGKGKFPSLWDFCERVDGKRCNKKVIEALIKAGAFDSFGVNRARLVAAIDGAVDRGQQAQRDRDSGQTSLFGRISSGPTPATASHSHDEAYPEVGDWLPRQTLAFEKEALGFYISGHPIDRYRADLQRFRATLVADLAAQPDRAEVSVGGMVNDFHERPLKSGNGRMCSFSLEDPTGQIRVVCFSKPFAENEEVLKSGEPILVTGSLVEEGEGEGRARVIHLKEVSLLSRLRTERTKRMVVQVPADQLKAQQAQALRTLLELNAGSVTTVLRLVIPRRSHTDVVLPARFGVSPTDELLAGLEKLLGADTVRLA